MSKILCPECRHWINNHSSEKGCMVETSLNPINFCECKCSPEDIASKIVTESIVEWIVQNVSSNDVPGDEGNEEALIYNLVHNALKDGNKYEYLDEQDAEIEALLIKYGRTDLM